MKRKINKIFYIYKIHFLCGFPSGRYYIGKHTHRAKTLKNDHYTGSGDFCLKYFNKYGKQEGITYVKEILEINPDDKTNSNREAIIIGDLWKTDKLCMNMRPGGNGGAIPGVSFSRPKQRKKVNQYTKDGVFIKTGDSIIEAERFYSKRTKPFDSGSSIRAAIRGLNPRAFGFQGRYYNGDINNIQPSKSRKKQKCKHVLQFDVNKQLVAEGDSASNAANGINKPGLKSNIQAACKKNLGYAGGYYGKYVD